MKIVPIRGSESSDIFSAESSDTLPLTLTAKMSTKIKFSADQMEVNTK